MKYRMKLREDFGNQTISGHRVKNAALSKQHHQDHGRETEENRHRNKLAQPTVASHVGLDRIGHRGFFALGRIAEVLVGGDPRQHPAKEDVEDRAYDERAQDTDRHVPLWSLGLLCYGRDRIESDECKEDHTGSTKNPPQATEGMRLTRNGIRDGRSFRDEWHVVGRIDKLPTQGDKHHHDQYLDAYDNRIKERRFFDPSDQDQGQNKQNKNGW
jgi:hypothetical protein